MGTPAPAASVHASEVAALLRRRLVAIMLIVLTLALPGIAAASPAAVLRDLNDNGIIDRCYSLSDFRAALAELPPDSAQYSSNAQAIEQAMLDHVKRPGEPCPNVPDQTTTASAGIDGGDNTVGYVILGIVGAALATAAGVGAILARRSRRDRDGGSGDAGA